MPQQATITNTPRNPILGLLADAIQPVANSGLLGEFLLGKSGKVLDDMSYGYSPTTGRGMTTGVKPDAVDLLNLTPLAGVTKPLAKMAGRELARQVQTGTGLVGRNVIDPRQNIVAYRGISKPYDENYKQAIEWFSESPELANVYSGLGEGSNIIKKDLGDIDKNVADLGFRNSSAEVPFNEIKSRLINSIVKKIDNENLTKNDAKEIVKNIQNYNPNDNLKKVHHWWQEDDIIANSLKKAGYDAIKDEERGFKTYGLLK